MDNTHKHRRFIWLAAIAVAMYFFAPQLIGIALQLMFSRPQALVHSAPVLKTGNPPKALKAPGPKPAAAVTTPGTAPAANAANVSVADAALFANFSGDWQGRAALPRHRMCTLKFELRENYEPEHPYAGYSNLVCTPFWPYGPGRARMDGAAILTASQSPMSAILSGTPRNGSIQFHVEKTLGSNCPMTALTLTPFGAKQIAVEWEDTFCGGGQMILTRTR